MIKGKRILCAGGAGSIGNELVRQLALDNEIYIIDINETGMYELVEEIGIKGRVGDIRNKDVLKEMFYDFRPDVVFHAAALKHVTPNEWNPMEAVYTNIVGTDNIIQCCKRFNSNLINISTDKVVHAHSIMGMTKKIAEHLVIRRQAGDRA